MRQRIYNKAGVLPPSYGQGRPLFQLVLDFESAQSCVDAKRHVKEGRLRVQGEKRGKVSKLIQAVVEEESGSPPLLRTSRYTDGSTTKPDVPTGTSPNEEESIMEEHSPPPTRPKEQDDLWCPTSTEEKDQPSSGHVQLELDEVSSSATIEPLAFPEMMMGQPEPLAEQPIPP
jgi:hypothetical protein